MRQFVRFIIMETVCILNYLKKNPIFSMAKEENLKQIIQEGCCKAVRYTRGEFILSPAICDRKIIIVISGSADVYSSPKGEGVMLTRLNEGSMSGVSNLFADANFESYVVAHEKSEILEIHVSGIRYLIETDRNFTYGYINFLSDRICYLNKKIKYITAQTPEGALAKYLDSVSEFDSFSLPLPMNSIADILNIGRASLYRAMEKLSDSGHIKRDGRNVIILDRKGMLEVYL